MTDVRPFDLFGALPEGTVLLEASAGTGKTYTIAALACRYIAERGLTIDQLLMVTFGTAATNELRTRVYQQLDDTSAAIEAFLANGDLPDDALAAHLASEAPQLRAHRLREAMAAFDEAAITTTHTFCATMLDRLGVVADWDAHSRFTANLSELTEDAADDLYVRSFASQASPPFTIDYARKIARQAVEHSDEIFRAPGHEAEADFADGVRASVAERKARAQLYTYDDLIERMRATMTDPLTGPIARHRLSQLYPVVLVDEFQDTDPQQWLIIKQAFIGANTLVLIGDPKQSIYGFRNADLHCYTDAMGEADAHFTLPINYRSDPGVVTAINSLFSGVELGDERVVVRPSVAHRTHNRLSRHDGRPSALARVRMAPEQRVTRDAGAALIERDLVAQVSTLLADYTLDGRPLAPRDIAILVRQRRQAEAYARALNAADIAAVFPGAESIFATRAAGDWAAVLACWLHPTPRAVRAAALSDIAGLSVEALAADDGTLVGDVAERLRTAGHIAESSGITAGWQTLRDLFDIEARLLGRIDGEAMLVDLGHVAELLSGVAWRERFGLEALSTWLGRERANARLREDDQDISRRLARDADAVQLVTMHGAKGLQFPVVLVPSASEWSPIGEKNPFVFSEGGQRRLFVGGAMRRAVSWQRHLDDERAEELRLLYVALTRAQSAIIAWWVPTPATSGSPLHRLLSRGEAQHPRPDYPDAAAQDWPARFADPAIAFEAIEAAAPALRPRPATPVVPLRARTFTRAVDQDWRRTSYSGLTADAHDVDETAAHPLATEGLDVPLPLGDMPGGTAVGSLVHLVLEYLDWSQPDLGAAVDTVLAGQLARLPIPGIEAATLRDGLVAALETPLGPLASGLRLRDLPVNQRLAELDFDLPLGTRGVGTVADLAAAMASQLSADDLLVDYPAHLAASPAAHEGLSGFLTGSIDAVLHVDGRYLIVDYKTNRLAPPGEPLTLAHYTPVAMARAMIASHYPLQALLYSVALHRFLAWRLPDYSPERHLGGAGYLFVRGMIGADTPSVDGMPCGVFTWRPSPALVGEASAILGGDHG